MAKPDPSNGHARIANELIRSALSKINLSPYEWRILWTVIGLSWSWQGRKGAYTSMRELSAKTGLDLRHTHRAVKGLTEKFILITRSGTKKTWVEINTDYDTWKLPKGENLFNLLLPVEATQSVASRGNTESPETVEPFDIQAELKKFLKTIR
jgi:phage replication O-like protein O